MTNAECISKWFKLFSTISRFGLAIVEPDGGSKLGPISWWLSITWFQEVSHPLPCQLYQLISYQNLPINLLLFHKVDLKYYFELYFDILFIPLKLWISENHNYLSINVYTSFSGSALTWKVKSGNQFQMFIFYNWRTSRRLARNEDYFISICLESYEL